MDYRCVKDCETPCDPGPWCSGFVSADDALPGNIMDAPRERLVPDLWDRKCACCVYYDASAQVCTQQYAWVDGRVHFGPFDSCGYWRMKP